jgi:transposase-like protein
MDKAAMRAEAERLMREAMERKAVTVKQGETVIMINCGKCGAPNKVKAPKGESRVDYVCKECGAKQRTM